MGSGESIDTKKPKVFIWVGGWKGGAENVMLGIAEILREKFGIIPTLGVFEKNMEVDFPQIVVKRLFPRRLVGYNSIWASLYLRKKGILDKFDIIIAHTGGFWKTKANFYVYHEAADLNRILKNLTMISKVIYFPVYVIALRSLNEADLVFSASPECSLFLDRLGVKHEKTSSFVDTRLFRPLGIKRDNVVLFVGRKHSQKNLNALIDGLLSIDKVRLLVAGFSSPNEMNKRITYLGWVNRTKLPVVYNSVKMFALPSLGEGFPLTILEALACKTPVVASVYAVPKILKDVVFEFDPFNLADIRSSILLVLMNPKLARKRTVFGHFRVVKSYDRRHVLVTEALRILYRFNIQ